MKTSKLLSAALVIVLGTTAICTETCAQKSAEAPLERYDIASAGNATGQDGTYLVTATVWSKKKKVTDGQLKYAAVHGVIFRGFATKEGQQPALADKLSVEQQHADYFGAFFAEDGPYTQFASIMPGTYSIVRGADKRYRISATVSVQKERLRKELDSAGVTSSDFSSY